MSRTSKGGDYIEQQTEQKSVYILSIDAKDLYDANHLINPNPEGYNIRTADGTLLLTKFFNTLDFSLELIKLRQVYEQTYRRRGFSFFEKDKEYSQAVINVTFKYSYKEWNQIKRRDPDTNTYIVHYIKAGYAYEELTFHDRLAFIDGELAGVMVDAPVNIPVSEAVLGDTFMFDNEEHVYRIRHSKNATLKTRKELRQEMYENGFYCDGKKYVRFKRSSGSSRVGKCLFIEEPMHRRMRIWEKCGIKLRTNALVDLAGWEAYIALTLSSLIGTLELRPENILLIDDYESTFEDEMMAIGFEDGWLTAEAKTTEISNCIWDGQSLLDVSMFKGYEDKGMLLLRTRFFKSACFNTNIQKFFKDRGITDVSQLKGQTRAKKIEDIKLITTSSSVKYLKFGSWDDWLDNLEPTFGIVKYDKPTHFFGGDLVQAHYQLLNTLHMSKQDVKELLAESKDYYRQLDTDPAVFRYHVGCLGSDDDSDDHLNFKYRNSVLYFLLGHNHLFAKTKLYHDWKKKLLKSFKDQVRKGHVLVKGTYATLLGNPYEMLTASIGEFDGTSLLGQGNVWCPKFEDGEDLLGSRSPHVAAGNILVTKNKRHDLIDRYFNLSPYIVCINSIEENILERLSGADMDSDTMLLTSKPLLVKKAKQHYDDFLVPTKLIPAATTLRHYNDTDKADLDHVTADNQIGEIVNLSQELNSLLWHKLNETGSFDEVAGIYEDIAKLDVLSNIEIDRAKREYAVDSSREMKKIRQKYKMKTDDGKKIKPRFFAHISRAKGYYNPIRNEYVAHRTTMDYLDSQVKSWRIKPVYLRKRTLRDFVPLSQVWSLPYYSRAKVRDHQVDKIIALVQNTQNRLSGLRAKIKIEYDQDIKRRYARRMDDVIAEAVKDLFRINPTRSTIYWLMTQMDEPEYKDIRFLFLKLLFGHPTENFRRFLREAATGISIIRRCPNGEKSLYGINFTEIDETYD